MSATISLRKFFLLELVLWVEYQLPVFEQEYSDKGERITATIKLKKLFDYKKGVSTFFLYGKKFKATPTLPADLFGNTGPVISIHDGA